jgi:hypothetical protein
MRRDRHEDRVADINGRFDPALITLRLELRGARVQSGAITRAEFARQLVEQARPSFVIEPPKSMQPIRTGKLK